MKRPVIFMLCNLMYLLSFGITLGNLNYNVYDYDRYGIGLAEVSCSNTGISGSVEIPGGASAGGTQFNVVRVAQNGFQACTNLTSISLPPTLTSVEERGFYLCTSLKSVAFRPTYYDPVKIGKEAFSQCKSLTSITFPEQTVSLGESVLAQCGSLTTVQLPSTLRSIGNYAFAGCNNLQKVYASSLASWCNVEIANFEASPFSHNTAAELIVDNKAVTTLEVPAATKRTGAYIFAGCNTIKKLVFHENFKEIGEGCFQYASNIDEITSLSLTPPQAGSYCFDGVSKNIPVHVPDVALEAYRAASGWSKFTNYVPIVTETADKFTVNGIMYSATDMPLGECKVIGSDLRNISIPEVVKFNNTNYSVTKIGDEAFARAGLSSVTLPSSLKEIGKGAFYMTSLKEITIPSSTTIIADEAFNWCFDLANVYFKSGSKLSSIGESAFCKCLALGSITLPSSLRYVGDNAFRECSNLIYLNIGDGLERIGAYAFMATGIVNLTLPQSVSTIGANAFISCNNLKTVLSASPRLFVDNGAFWHCSGLTEMCILAEELIAPECKPFNKGGIKIYVNKPLYDTMKKNHVWEGQELTAREITIKDETFFQNGRFEIGADLIFIFDYNVQDASMISHNIDWHSTDPNIFTYAEKYEWFSGNFLKGVSVGSATLVAEGAYGLKAEYPVSVSPKADNIFLSQTKPSLNIGETDTISVVTVPGNAYVNLEWSTSDESVVSIVETIDYGRKIKVRANALGQSTIIAKNSYDDLKARCNLKVVPVLVESLSISPAAWEGTEGESFQLYVTVLPENAADKRLVYFSTDTSVATVTPEGYVSVLKEGSCRIIVSTADGSNITAECAITSTSGIEDIVGDDTTAWNVYDINGILLKKDCDRTGLKTLQPGIYILHSGQKTIRVIIH